MAAERPDPGFPIEGREPVVCVCGGWWFELVDGAGGEPPAVTLDADGHVSGWSGELRCRECRTPAALPTGLL